MIAQQKAWMGTPFRAMLARRIAGPCRACSKTTAWSGRSATMSSFWIGRNAFKATAPSVRRFFSCSLKNSQPGWSLNGRDPPQVVHGSGIACAGHDAFQSLTKLHLAGFLTKQNTARSDGEDKTGRKFHAMQHAVKLAIESGEALLHDEHACFVIEVNPVQARCKALQPNGRARGATVPSRQRTPAALKM